MLFVMQCPPGQEDVYVETDQIVPACVLESFALIKWSLFYHFFSLEKKSGEVCLVFTFDI